MKNYTKLDNLTCQEIKEMIYDNRIELTSLESAVLKKLMDYEVDLLCIGEGSVDFIESCSDILSERETELLSHDEFMSIVDETLKKQTAPQQKRLNLKRAIIIAAAVATLLVGSTMIASAVGFNLFDYIRQIAREPEGTEKEEGGITLYNGGETKKYATLKEAIENENLNIMYPASMPEGVAVENVRITDSDIGDTNIQILTNDNRAIFIVDTSVTPNDKTPQNKNLYHKDGVDYILFERETENRYGAYCNVNNCDYTIQTKTYEDLIYIIESMEEN